MITTMLKKYDENNFWNDFDDFFDTSRWAGDAIKYYNYVYDSDKSEWVISLDLPGYNKTEIEIDYSDRYIHIQAKNEKRGKQTYRYVRYQNMNFEYATSKYENGVLEIRIPKEVEKKEEKRRIEVK